MKKFKKVFGLLRHRLPGVVGVAAENCITPNCRQYCPASFLSFLRPVPSPLNKTHRTLSQREYVENAQLNMFGGMNSRPKCVLIHDRNSLVPTETRLTINDYNSKSLDGGPNAFQCQIAERPIVHRSYAQMIEEYSFDYDRLKEFADIKDNSGSLFSRFPVDASLNALKLEGKIGKSKSNGSLKRSGKSYGITDKSNKKKIPELFNRGYFTELKQDHEMYRLQNDEIDEWVKRVRQHNKNMKLASGSKAWKNFQRTSLMMDGNIINELGKKEFVKQWIRSNNFKEVINGSAVSVAANDSAPTEIPPTEMKKLNVVTSNNKIEIQIPLDIQLTNNQTAHSKESMLSLQISAKFQEKRINTKSLHTDTTLQGRMQSPTSKEALPRQCKENDEAGKKTPKMFIPPDKTAKEAKEKTVPWWASKDCTPDGKPKDPTKLDSCLQEIYEKTPGKIKVLATEEFTDRRSEEPVKSRPISAVKSEHSKPGCARAVKSRRSRKMTNIAKITRHLEEEIKEAKKAAEEQQKQAEIEKKNAPEAKAAGKEAAAGDKDEENKDEKSKDDGLNNNGNIKKESKGQADEKKSGFSIGALFDKANKTSANVETMLADKNDKPEKPNITILDKSIKEIEKRHRDETKRKPDNFPDIGRKPKPTFSKVEMKADKSKSEPPKKKDTSPDNPERKAPRREDGLIDWGLAMKNIPENLRPIEKKKDGSIIDYGLKVPTRKAGRKSKEKEAESAKVADAPQQPKKEEYKHVRFKTDDAPSVKSYKHKEDVKVDLPRTRKKRSVVAKIKPIATTKADENLIVDKAKPEQKSLNPMIVENVGKREIRNLKDLTKSSVPPGKALASSDQKPELKDKVKDNVLLASKKKDGNPEDGGGSDALPSSSPNDTSTFRNPDPGKQGRPTFEVGELIPGFTPSRQIWERMMKPPMQCLGDGQTRRFEDKISASIQRPEHNLIYSVWLNKFHARKQYTIFTK